MRGSTARSTIEVHTRQGEASSASRSPSFYTVEPKNKIHPLLCKARNGIIFKAGGKPMEQEVVERKTIVLAIRKELREMRIIL
jgi:hypothetical protein